MPELVGVLDASTYDEPVSRMTVGGDAAYILGLGASGSGTYQPSTYCLSNKAADISLIAGLGADVYVRKEVSTPVLGGLAPDGLTLGPSSSRTTPNYVIAPRNTSPVMTSGTPSFSAYRPQTNYSFSIPGVSSGGATSKSSTSSGGGQVWGSVVGGFNPFLPR